MATTPIAYLFCVEWNAMFIFLDVGIIILYKYFERYHVLGIYCCWPIVPRSHRCVLDTVL